MCALSPTPDIGRRRATFADLLDRAALAYLHHRATGTPLVPDLDAYPGLAERMPGR